MVKENKIIWYMGFLFAILLVYGIMHVEADQLGTNQNKENSTVPVIIQNSANSANPAVVPAKDSTLTLSEKMADSSNANLPVTISGTNSIGSIEGQIFEDLNANDIRDIEQIGIAGDEVVLSGFKVNLKGKDLTNKPVSLTTISDENGNYYFIGLSDGNYTVSETLSNGWTQTFATEFNIIINNGSNVFGQNFGNIHRGKIMGGLKTLGKNEKRIEDPTVIEGQSFNLAKNRIEYKDDSTTLMIESVQINSVATTLDKRKGVITGLAKVNGEGSYPFTIYVEADSDKDLLEISVPTYKYSNRIILAKGDIQLDS